MKLGKWLYYLSKHIKYYTRFLIERQLGVILTFHEIMNSFSTPLHLQFSYYIVIGNSDKSWYSLNRVFYIRLDYSFINILCQNLDLIFHVLTLATILFTFCMVDIIVRCKHTDHLQFFYKGFRRIQNIYLFYYKLFTCFSTGTHKNLTLR